MQGKVAGPSSRLSNRSATRKRKPMRERLQDTRVDIVPETARKEGNTLDDLNPYRMGRKSR